MKQIPELAQACKLHQRIQNRKTATSAEEAECRKLWLQATAKGATRIEIMASCQIGQSFLESELKKARQETDDPELAKTRTAKGGLTLGEYWCPEAGCERSAAPKHESLGPLGSAQALGMHRVAAHGYMLGENRLTEDMVRKARKSKRTTRELAKEWGVSPHALGAARKGRTWKQVA